MTFLKIGKQEVFKSVLDQFCLWEKIINALNYRIGGRQQIGKSDTYFALLGVSYSLPELNLNIYLGLEIKKKLYWNCECNQDARK